MRRKVILNTVLEGIEEENKVRRGREWGRLTALERWI